MVVVLFVKKVAAERTEMFCAFSNNFIKSLKGKPLPLKTVRSTRADRFIL